MNIVFIGGGHVFGYHSAQFRSVFGKAEYFVVEPDDKVAALAYIPRISFEEAVDIADLAIIMTPSYVRWEVCEPFIKKNTPLVVEKPLTINWDEIKSFESAKKAWICPILNARVQRGVEEIINQSKNPKYIKLWKNRCIDKKYYNGWHGKYASDGGALAQQGFHCLDLACFIGGTPLSVKAKGFNHYHKIECEDTALVEIKFESGCVANIHCTTAAMRDDVSAGLSVDGLGTSGLQFSDKGKAGHTIIAERVKMALESGGDPPISLESAIPSLYALHACYVSMDNDGAEVKLGERHLKLGEHKVSI